MMKMDFEDDFEHKEWWGMIFVINLVQKWIKMMNFRVRVREEGNGFRESENRFAEWIEEDE